MKQPWRFRFQPRIFGISVDIARRYRHSPVWEHSWIRVGTRGRLWVNKLWKTQTCVPQSATGVVSPERQQKIAIKLDALEKESYHRSRMPGWQPIAFMRHLAAQTRDANGVITNMKPRKQRVADAVRALDECLQKKEDL